MRALLAFLMAAAAWAQNSIAPPQVGFMQDTSGTVRPVYGIAGNFLPGDAVAWGVVSSAFSSFFGMVKTGSALFAIDQQGQVIASLEAAGGPALFAFSRECSYAYLPAAKSLLAWSAESFHSLPFDEAVLNGGSVLSIAAPDSDHVSMIVQRDGEIREVRILLATGEIDSQRSFPGVAAPVLMLASGELLYADAQGIMIRKPDGSERRIAVQLPESFALAQMSDSWVELMDLAGGPNFALRITDNREQAYQLPEVGQ